MGEEEDVTYCAFVVHVAMCARIRCLLRSETLLDRQSNMSWELLNFFPVQAIQAIAPRVLLTVVGVMTLAVYFPRLLAPFLVRSANFIVWCCKLFFTAGLLTALHVSGDAILSLRVSDLRRVVGWSRHTLDYIVARAPRMQLPSYSSHVLVGVTVFVLTIVVGYHYTLRPTNSPPHPVRGWHEPGCVLGISVWRQRQGANRGGPSKEIWTYQNNC